MPRNKQNKRTTAVLRDGQPTFTRTRNTNKRGNRAAKIEIKAIKEGKPPIVAKSRVVQSRSDRGSNFVNRELPMLLDAHARGPTGFGTSALPVRPVPKRFNRKNGEFEKYMAALAMPEKFGRNIRVPDKFIGETSAYPTIINKNIPLLVAGASSSNVGNAYAFGDNNNFPTGGFLMRATPSWSSPVAYMAETSTTAADTWWINLTKEEYLTGFRDLQDSAADASDLTGNMLLTAEPQNLVGWLQTDQLTPPTLSLPFKNQTIEETYFFGYSIDFTGSTITLSMNTSFVGTTINNGVYYQWINTAGVVNTGQFNLVTGLNAFTLSLPSNPDCRGDRMVGLRIGLQGGAIQKEIIVSALQLQIAFSTDASQLTWACLQQRDFPKADGIYDKYRVVAMSMLTSCMGTDYTNGGVCAGLLEYGGRPFCFNGNTEEGFNWTYNGLASARRDYQGAMKTGEYTWWHPADESDMMFKRRQDSNTYRGAHIVHAGAFTPVSLSSGVAVPLNALRVRVVLCYECTTIIDCVGTAPSPSNPAVLERVKRLVDSEDIPTSMQNDTHSEVLKWMTLPLDFAEAAIPKVSNIMEKAGPLMKLLGFSMFL